MISRAFANADTRTDADCVARAGADGDAGAYANRYAYAGADVDANSHPDARPDRSAVPRGEGGGIARLADADRGGCLARPAVANRDCDARRQSNRRR